MADLPMLRWTDESVNGDLGLARRSTTRRSPGGSEGGARRSVDEPARHSVALRSNHSSERRLDSLAAGRGGPVEMRASGRDPGSTPAVKVRFLVVFLLDDGVVSGRKDTGMGGGWNRVRGGHEGLCEICNNNGHGHTGPDTMIFVVWSGDG
ncbi:pollen-specific leucine-rich repeat extensin-like protein 3 [Iris pallida]|uniref:Pollen-specific leucine-rich repeat extensin-like protein 3 n=1 Tax=Iris pallida TaxID=29817 RepID=A0AAX6F8W3_IRIPA|nr:pollen-specific leucine-rich repeat extensin-like protein 3 [Iris pallida]